MARRRSGHGMLATLSAGVAGQQSIESHVPLQYAVITARIIIIIIIIAVHGVQC